MDAATEEPFCLRYKGSATESNTHRLFAKLWLGAHKLYNSASITTSRLPQDFRPMMFWDVIPFIGGRLRMTSFNVERLMPQHVSCWSSGMKIKATWDHPLLQPSSTFRAIVTIVTLHHLSGTWPSNLPPREPLPGAKLQKVYLLGSLGHRGMARWRSKEKTRQLAYLLLP